MRSRLHEFVREDGISELEAALRAIAMLGVDLTSSPDESGVPLYMRGSVYLVSYAEAKLDEAKFDEWNPDQPRDEAGKWASGDGYTQAGAVKSGASAVEKATSGAELQKIASSLAGSAKMAAASKSKLYDKLGQKAQLLGDDKLAEEYTKKANELWFDKGGQAESGMAPEAEVTEKTVNFGSFDNGDYDDEAAIAKEFGPGHTWEKDGVGNIIVTQKDGTQWKAEDNGEGEHTFEKVPGGGDGGGGDELKVGADAFGVDNPEDMVAAIEDELGDGVSVTMGEDGDTVTIETENGKYVGKISDGGEDGVTFSKVAEGAAAGSLTDQILNGKPGDAELYEKAKKELTEKYGNPTEKEIQKKAASLAKGESYIGEKDDLAAESVPDKGTPEYQQKLEAAVEAAKVKPQEQLDHGKEARDAAKKIVQHSKDLRAQYKKNPTPELKKKVEAAEKAAKAARAAARKAEKAKSPEEAKKHAEKAKAHHAKLVGGDEEAQAFVVSKAGATSKPSGGAPKIAKDPGADPKLHAKAQKLLDQANTPHPEGWSKEKVEAKEFAKQTLEKHANAKTTEEYKEAAKAFKEVASKASAAGSYWGSGYNDLADEYLDKATPQETFEVGKAGSGDHSSPPSKSARPIDDIKGDIVPEKTFKKHREDYSATLSSKEKSAALSYSGSSYSTINTHLRAGKEPTEQMKYLDKAIAKAPAPKDMLVHRGMSGDFVEKLFSGLQPGDQFVEKAYTSTSAGGSSAFGGSVEMHITVPKGYPVAPIPSHHPHEREYLLRRNTKFQVTKVEKTKNSYGGYKYVAHVTVVHDQEEN
jgi:hypothetical protein